MNMNRRDLMTLAAASGAAIVAGGAAAATAATPATKGIVLFCELAVDPKREKEMLDHFHKVFHPVATKHKGFIDLKMLKFTKHVQGPSLPKGILYRFQLTYENEDLRLAWVNSDDHVKAWPGIEAALLDKNFEVEIYDIV